MIPNFIKNLLLKKKEKIKNKKSKKSSKEIDAEIESILAKKVIDIKTLLKYKILEIIAINSAVFSSIDSINTFLKDKNIDIDIDINETTTIVKSIIKYRFIKECLAINGKSLSTGEQSMLLSTICNKLNLKLMDGTITNNTTMVLGSNYLDSVDMVKNLVKELDETSKALENGIYTETER